MRKIINGKMYNTDTAEELGSFWNGYGGGDFNYMEETLYRKKTGEFFLHGKGGALSKYAEQEGTGTCGGEGIIPITEAEARQWAEEHLDADEYIEVFGPVEE